MHFLNINNCFKIKNHKKVYTLKRSIWTLLIYKNWIRQPEWIKFVFINIFINTQSESLLHDNLNCHKFEVFSPIFIVVIVAVGVVVVISVFIFIVVGDVVAVVVVAAADVVVIVVVDVVAAIFVIIVCGGDCYLYIVLAFIRHYVMFYCNISCHVVYRSVLVYFKECERFVHYDSLGACNEKAAEALAVKLSPTLCSTS